MEYAGVDGCKGGWAAVVGTDAGRFAFSVVPRFVTFVEAHQDALILVDIPIGLRESGSDERLCDLAARKCLGRRSSSVFPAPVRAALHASDYRTASSINKAKTRSDSSDGRGLNQQSF